MSVPMVAHQLVIFTGSLLAVLNKRALILCHCGNDIRIVAFKTIALSYYSKLFTDDPVNPLSNPY